MKPYDIRTITAYVRMALGVVLVILFGYMVITNQTDADIMIRVLTLIVGSGWLAVGGPEAIAAHQENKNH